MEFPDAPARHQGGAGAAGRRYAGRETGANDTANDAAVRGDLWRDPARRCFNVIVDQNDLGDALSSHVDVAKVTFTGSTATGKKVMGSVTGTLKRFTLELGGNDAAIVLDDVDPVEVAPKCSAPR